MSDEESEQTITRPADQPEGWADVPSAVVGVGVCAASLRSLAALFSDVRAGIGAGYLVVARQKKGLDVAAVIETLSTHAALPVALAEDGDVIAADRIYVAAPDDMVTIEHGRIRTRPASEPVGHRGMLDTLLMSLAEQVNERAVAVILSGLGSEGTAGVVATKKFGGLSIAEDNGDQPDPSAQGSTGPAAVADLRLPIARIAAEIARYVRNIQVLVEAEDQEADGDQFEAQVTQVATILRNVTSHDFHGYKRGTFVRRIQRRMQVMQIEGIDTYLQRLRGDREEVQLLFQDLLIGVTQFFRDPAEFETLERELPRLFENKNADDHFRVWVLGCATGEEAYSLAILLREHMATMDHPPEVQIFATDLDARALSIARTARYSDAIADHTRPDRLERWFSQEGDTYCVSKELREMCIFSPHNIVKDAPFSRVDILSCRNLLIYLNTELQNRVIPIFHFSLVADGVLFLGSSENVTRHQKLFAPVDRKSRVFRRLDTPTRIIPDFPLTRVRGAEPGRVGLPPVQFAGQLPGSVSRQADAVAERYAPAHVVVDAHGEVLHFSGRTGRYLEPSAGAASLSLPNLVHRDLRLDVRSALQRAVAEGQRVEVPRLAVHHESHTSGVNLIVEPLSSSDVTMLVVVFQDVGPVSDAGGPVDERLTADQHVRRLEAELKVTRDRLQATIEELESTNEELKSSNEEYQSINEELQSANEEMETSKEELQSVNEELQTVNGELGHRVSELGRINSDLKNLLEATQIATVFLDNDLRVRNFTPAATEIFHLLDTDVGRPLDHVVSRVDYPELLDDVRQVLKTLVPVDRQVMDRTRSRNFAARVMPYRSVDNYISGAVVTFTDFTPVYLAQSALRELEARQQVLISGVAQLVWRAAEPGKWTWASPQWTTVTGQAEVDSHGLGWLEPLHPDDRDAAMAAWDKAGERGEFAIEYRIRVSETGEYRWFQTRAKPVRDAWGEIVEWLGTSTDVNDLRTFQRRQEVLVAELQHRVRNMLTVVRSVFNQTVEAGGPLEDMADHFKGRLDALARTQVIVTRNADGIADLEDLVREELLSVGAQEGAEVRIEGPEVKLRSKTAESMGLALHELTTNALKYGALKVAGAKLEITWDINVDDGGVRRLDLNWVEQGVPAVPTKPTREGYGRELIEEALPYRLGADTRLEFRGGGVRCFISLPLEGERAGH